jgi:hypothetical protein
MSVLIGSGADQFGISVDGSQEAAYVAKVLALSPITYFTLGEHEGSVAYCAVDPNQNGTHNNLQGALGNAGIGDGQVCPLYNPAGPGYTDLQTVALAADFDGQTGTLSLWDKVSGASVWTDGTTRIIAIVYVDGNNFIQISRTAVNGDLEYRYVANGTTETITVNGLSTTGWMHHGLTWDLGADEVKAFYNGVQTGATQSGLGTWAGAPTAVYVGVGALVNFPWSGYAGHVALWDSALTPGQVATLAVA